MLTQVGRAPASTMIISIRSAGSSSSRSDSFASFSAFCGRPSARSQSAITGR